MWTRVEKRINDRDADKIRKIQKKINFVRNIDDQSFLLNDVLSSKASREDKKEFVRFLSNENVGKIADQECELNLFYDDELCYSVKPKRNGEYTAYIEIFAIKESSHLNDEEIHFGLAYVDDSSTPFSIFPQSRPPSKNIFSLATYFYNKYSVYLKISEILKSKRDYFLDEIGEDYTDDLINLFSVKKQNGNTEDFSIPEENIVNDTYYEDTCPLPERDAFRAKIDFFSGPILDDLEIYLSLTNKNTICFDTLSAGNSILKKAGFYNFINIQTNVWLKEMEEMSNFALAVYDKVKTKIVLGRI